jgi:drug/metabolite transporter (DMT)-like permease
MGPHTHERIGILAAATSSALGGIAGGTTRFVVGATDPVTLGLFRFGVGFLLLLPRALALRGRWPKGKDWIAVVLLGILFFFAFSAISVCSAVPSSSTSGRSRRGG